MAIGYVAVQTTTGVARTDTYASRGGGECEEMAIVCSRRCGVVGRSASGTSCVVGRLRMSLTLASFTHRVEIVVLVHTCKQTRRAGYNRVLKSMAKRDEPSLEPHSEA